MQSEHTCDEEKEEKILLEAETAPNLTCTYIVYPMQNMNQLYVLRLTISCSYSV